MKVVRGLSYFGGIALRCWTVAPRSKRGTNCHWLGRELIKDQCASYFGSVESL